MVSQIEPQVEVSRRLTQHIEGEGDNILRAELQATVAVLASELWSLNQPTHHDHDDYLTIDPSKVQ